MSVIRNRRALVALLLMGSAILLFSCKSTPKVAEVSLDSVRTEESENLTIVMSENGRKSYHFKTPLLEGYMLGREPYREFRKGITITTYQDDSLTTVNAVLVANSDGVDAVDLHASTYLAVGGRSRFENYGEELDSEIYEIMAASAETLERCQMYVVLPYETRALYNKLWIQLGI